MRIAGRDSSRKVLVVAEAGNNHEGSFAAAERMVREAARCGADAVKFQTFRTELFTGPADPARVKRLKSFELSFDDFRQLAKTAREEGLAFLSTPLDMESAAFLAEAADGIKIASGDNDFAPLIDFAARTRLPLILSGGMTDLEGLRAAAVRVRAARPAAGADWAVLHCVTSYPVPDDQANLSVIPLLKEALACEVGYSDHTLGVDACVAAVALGATILEKHFTLNKNASEFRDHKISADPAELAELVRRVRRVEAMRGSGVKVVQECERPFVSVARRSIAAARELPAGHVLAAGDLAWLRPAGGLKPGQEGELLGRTLSRAVQRGEPLTAGHVEGR